MVDRVGSKIGGVLWRVVLGAVLVVGCADPSDSSRSAPGGVMGEPVARAPVAPRRFATVPQVAFETLPASLVPWAAPALPADASLDARLLVITADGTDPAYAAIAETLRYLGTPFDTFNPSLEPDLTADRLATGSRGHYYGVVLDRGNLSTGSVSALSPTEWAVLGDYEARFQVRRVALYAYPEASYGLAPATPSVAVDTTTAPLPIHCTESGAVVFANTPCSVGLIIKGAFAYPATALGSTTIPLLVDDGGRVLAAIFTDAFARQYLSLTFAQAPSLVHSLSLIHDLVRWVTRGVFLGERHVYLASQIDDLFLASLLYPNCIGGPCGDGGAAVGSAPVATIGDAGAADGRTYRLTDLDLQALADWQHGPRGNPLTADLRFDWALNGYGTGAADPLTIRAQALGPSFKWISHTWDHTLLDNVSYAVALAEFTRNNTLVSSLGLLPYDIRSLVTPAISGLNNPDAIHAAFDAGIRFLVDDTSVAGWNNTSPNAGIYSAFQSEVLIIPRRPTNLFYNVSTPDEWQAEYNGIYRSYWGRDLSYAEILDVESTVLLQDLLRGANNPWMFHQANARNYGGGRSLLSDLHDSVLAKYAGASRLPIVSDTMDAVGERVAMRMQYDRSQATAVIGPGAQITVRVVNAASVPVTGLCTASAETYAGQEISYLQLAAGTEASLPLGGCHDGMGGNTGTGGELGAGGQVGSGGAGGADAGGELTAGGSLGAGGQVSGDGQGGAAVGTGTGGGLGARLTGNGGTIGDSEAEGMDGAAPDAVPVSPTPSSGGGCGCSFAESSPEASDLRLILAVVAMGALVTRRGRAARARLRHGAVDRERLQTEELRGRDRVVPGVHA